VQAVSSAISIIAASLSVTAPASGTVATALTVTGSVSPAADAVNVQLTTQNTTAPTSGWTAATKSGGSFSASLTPAAAGTYYAWAQDASTGVTAVSSAIAVSASAPVSYSFNNPGGTYTHGTSTTIGLNGGISPASATAVQVSLSTSNTAAPTSGWAGCTLLYSNTFWAVYYPTPATAGSYYVWIETTTGGDATVSSFTVTVT
jgi:hypothetical protein